MKVSLPGGENMGRHFIQKWRYLREVRVDDWAMRRLLESHGKLVHDAARLFGVVGDPPPPPVLKLQAKLEVKPPPVLRQETPAFLYRGQNLVMGFQQAQALTNTLLESESLPDRILALEGLYNITEQQRLVESVVKDKLMFDATQRKLPKYIDIKRLGRSQPRKFGIPNFRAYSGLLNGLWGLCDRLPSSVTCSVPRHVLLNPQISAVNTGACGERLVLCRRPELLTLSSRPLPPLTTVEQLEATRQLQPPQLAPLSPYVHLPPSRDYDADDVFPASVDDSIRHAHTLLVSVNSFMKHQVDEDQLASLSLMSMYAAASIMARRQLAESGEFRPVVVQCVATEGRLLRFSALQLNSLTLPDSSSTEPVTGDSLKNQLWIEPARPLYDVCGYVKGRPTLSELDHGVFERLLALYLHGQVEEEDVLRVARASS